MGRLRIDGSFYILTTILLMLVPIRWIFGAYLAAFFHECCHLAAIGLLGGHVRDITVTSAGAEITMFPLSNIKELLCAAAGPVGSLLFMIIFRRIPEFAIPALIQGAYNMLPIYPLDGGRVIKCILLHLFPENAQSLSTVIGILVVGLLVIFTVWWKFLPAILPVAALIRGSVRKIPCKEGNLAVQ